MSIVSKPSRDFSYVSQYPEIKNMQKISILTKYINRSKSRLPLSPCVDTTTREVSPVVQSDGVNGPVLGDDVAD